MRTRTDNAANKSISINLNSAYRPQRNHTMAHTHTQSHNVSAIGQTSQRSEPNLYASIQLRCNLHSLAVQAHSASERTAQSQICAPTSTPVSSQIPARVLRLCVPITKRLIALFAIRERARRQRRRPHETRDHDYNLSLVDTNTRDTRHTHTQMSMWNYWRHCLVVHAGRTALNRYIIAKRRADNVASTHGCG